MTRSAAQQRADAKVQYDAFLAECPSRDVLARVSDKWVTLCMSALAEGPQRYSEIAHRVAGVSPKMLTQTLRNLERDGLLSREVIATVPVTVRYELTPLGHSLQAVIAAVKGWAEAHIGDIRDARDVYDTGGRAAAR